MSHTKDPNIPQGHTDHSEDAYSHISTEPQLGYHSSISKQDLQSSSNEVL